MLNSIKLFSHQSNNVEKCYNEYEDIYNIKANENYFHFIFNSPKRIINVGKIKIKLKKGKKNFNNVKINPRKNFFFYEFQNKDLHEKYIGLLKNKSINRNRKSF